MCVDSPSGAELIALKPEDENRYLAYSVDGPFGKDTLEFLIKPSTTSGRNWEGDAETPIVTYRAIAGAHETHKGSFSFKMDHKMSAQRNLWRAPPQ